MTCNETESPPNLCEYATAVAHGCGVQPALRIPDLPAPQNTHTRTCAHSFPGYCGVRCCVWCLARVTVHTGKADPTNMADPTIPPTVRSSGASAGVTLVIAAICGLFAMSLYTGSLAGEFVFDDRSVMMP